MGSGCLRPSFLARSISALPNRSGRCGFCRRQGKRRRRSVPAFRLSGEPFGRSGFGRIPMQVAGFRGMALGMLLLLFAALTATWIHGSRLCHRRLCALQLRHERGAERDDLHLRARTLSYGDPRRGERIWRGGAKVGATFGTFVVPQLNAAWGLSGVVGLMLFVSVAGLVATAALAHAVNEEGALEE